MARYRYAQGWIERRIADAAGVAVAWAVVFGLYHLHNYSPALAALGAAVIYVWYTRKLNT